MSPADFIDDPVTDGKSQARSFADGFGCVKRIEHACYIGVRNSRSVIAYGDDDMVNCVCLAPSVMIPPVFSIASSALFTRFRKTCCISVSDAGIGGRFSSKSVLISTLLYFALWDERWAISLQAGSPPIFQLSASRFYGRNSIVCA